MWLIFAGMMRKVYLKNKAKIKKGEMWLLRMTYTFSYGLMVKMHESMFGLICYMLLLQFSCMSFGNPLGVLSFLYSLVVLAYLGYIFSTIYKKLNGENAKPKLWIAHHLTPLVAR